MESIVDEGLLGPLLLARSTIDRSAIFRNDAEWLEKAWADPKTRVLVVQNGHIALNGDGVALIEPSMAPEGERWLLGIDAEGVAYFATPGEVEGGHNLRQVGARLNDRDAGLTVYAVALEAWHSTHEFCPRCGTRTELASAGHMRVCPADQSQHFPRVDPAVIMLVHDDDDRILLGRGPQWPEGRVSVLAGFVEPGESLEQAVRREVFEEVGVAIAQPQYMGSQPWPFPRSLMLGFFARATTTEIHCDPEEIAEARWFTREELAAATASGEIGLPSGISIARRLIETWYGSTLPGSW